MGRRHSLYKYIFRYGLAVQHADDSMAIAGVMFGVGNHYDGRSLFVEIREQGHYLVTVRGVQVTCWFIRQDEFGVVYHGAGYGYTLLLTAGKLLRVVIAPVHDLHLVQHGFDALFSFRTFYTEIYEREFNVFEDGELVDEVKALEDEADVAFAQIGAFAFVEMGDFDAVEDKATAIGIVKQTEDIQKGGFTATGGTHYGDELAFFDFESEFIQRDGFHFFRAI